MNRNVIDQRKTEYGLLQVVDQEDRRVLLCDQQVESAIYIGPAKEKELVFPYMQRFSYAFAVNPDIKRTLLIGGGAFSYPRYYLDHYPDSMIDVIEISPDVLELDKEYFGLDEICSPRMNIIMENGFSYLKSCSAEYDLIINDAFTGSREEGRREEDNDLIHAHLTDNGIYVVNTAASLKGFHSFPYHHFIAGLQKKFQYTAVVQCEEDRNLYDKQNLLLIASDKTLL